MELYLKLGDQSISVTAVMPAVGERELVDPHRVVLSDALTGEVESLTLENEKQAVVFVREFLDSNGYPEGGVYDSKVKSKAFKY